MHNMYSSGKKRLPPLVTNLDYPLVNSSSVVWGRHVVRIFIMGGWHVGKNRIFAPQPYAADRGRRIGFSDNHIVSSLHLFCSGGGSVAPVPPPLATFLVCGRPQKRHFLQMIGRALILSLHI